MGQIVNFPGESKHWERCLPCNEWFEKKHLELHETTEQHEQAVAAMNVFVYMDLGRCPLCARQSDGRFPAVADCSEKEGHFNRIREANKIMNQKLYHGWVRG